MITSAKKLTNLIDKNIQLNGIYRLYVEIKKRSCELPQLLHIT